MNNILGKDGLKFRGMIAVELAKPLVKLNLDEVLIKGDLNTVIMQKSTMFECTLLLLTYSESDDRCNPAILFI